MTPKYFQLIYHQLSTIEDEALWVDEQVEAQLQLLKMDVRFLITFFLCHETWDYPNDDEETFDYTNDDDEETCDYTTDVEESKESLRSMITSSLKLIWSKEDKGLSVLDEDDDEYLSIQDFHIAMVELEAKIQQSKQHIEECCKYYMRSSMQIYHLSFHNIRYSLKQLLQNLRDFSRYRAEKIVPLKKQIDLLKDKISFLVNSLHNVKRCLDGKEIRPFLNFIGDVANNLACLSCLYWSKEYNEEIANEMNIVLFSMLQKFISSAYLITPLYFRILKSKDLQPSDSLLLGEAVDFFFEHLAIILNDDFLTLQDVIIFLFTFLADLPRENAEVEDLICSQINGLLHDDDDDAYLLLPFDEMKEDFLDKKMLLNGFLIKTDIIIDKIRQLHCGFSESWIRTEVEKMEYKYFVSIQRELSLIEKRAYWAYTVPYQLQVYRIELRFLRVFLQCFVTWDDADEESRVKLTSMINSLQGIWNKKESSNGLLLAPRLHLIRNGNNITDWLPLASELKEKIQQSKLEIEAWWVNLFHRSFQCRPSTMQKTIKFVDSILDILNDLFNFKAVEIAPLKKQIETLKDKLVFLHNFIKLASNCIDNKELEEFNIFVQVFANDAACLAFIYWAKKDSNNDEFASVTNSMISHMLKKIKPAMPDIARLYFGALKAISGQRSNSHMFGQIVLSCIDLFFDDLMTPLKDEFQILRDDIIFLLTFINDPPNDDASEFICSQIDVLFWESLYVLLPFDDSEWDFSKKKLLSDFMMKIDDANTKIRQNYGKFPDSSLYNFPKVISPWFLDFFLQDIRNLKERISNDHKFARFAIYKIIKIEDELFFLCPLFNRTFESQSEQDETWLEVVHLVHLMEHVMNSCICAWSVLDHPLWYHMAYIYHVFDIIKVIKTKLEKIQGNSMYNASCLPALAGFISTPMVEAIPLEINEMIIGFEDEVEKMIVNLTMGRVSLDTVSIVGMGGLGKTTLARMLYNSSLVKCNFHICAFSYVTHDYNTRNILLDILCQIKGIKGVDKRLSDMTVDDLKHELWKGLSRQKYLIVLDDIWNVSVWNDVNRSFPDDKNGSRVMFTTRDYEVANMCKIDCSPYQLRFLSEAESWELLQKKVFCNGISPPYLYEIGKVIAKSCKGLPLAVIVIAGLLARTEKNLKWWSEVAERVVSYLSNEGCMKILELSYTHLPKKLRPCLLYLGAFPENMLIRVKQVTLLWIAEGFIQESKNKSVEDVAKEYLYDLVSRCFIIANERSSTGEIKTFRIHDLIHGLCQMKCRDMNFFQLTDVCASSDSSNPSINNYYRVSIRKHCNATMDAGSALSNAHSLLFFGETNYDRFNEIPLREFRLAQVLNYYYIFEGYDTGQLSSLVHLRHIDACLIPNNSIIIPSWISSIWNLESLILSSLFYGEILLPETFWSMKSLRHVKVKNCYLKFSDACDEHEAYPRLDKVVSFSEPLLSTTKALHQLLQRLPVVRKLSCIFQKSFDYDGESIETLDFYRKLESLKLELRIIRGERNPYLINFPSTLRKLTLVCSHAPWRSISTVAKLQFLQVLKLRCISFPEQRLEMEDLVFQNLKFIELYKVDLVDWNASVESLPCLEQLVIECKTLEELPPCFGEIPTLKSFVVRNSPRVESSALRIQEELMELGMKVEVSIFNSDVKLEFFFEDQDM